MNWQDDQRADAAIVLPEVPAHVHFIGIGGIGMSGLARILLARGYRVTGSDATASDQTTALGAEEIDVVIGHGAMDQAAQADMVVMTAAIRPENPELRAALEANVQIVKRAQLLGMLANARRCVAVAGSHGKSTTSGMLAAAMLELNLEPSYAVGAVLAATGTNAAPGDGEIMVVEADEYDYSFLWLQPEVAIITNVEFDHPDLFADQSAYDEAFCRFAALVQPEGALVIAADDAGCGRLMARSDFVGPDRVITFGETANVDWRLSGSDGAWFVEERDGESHQLSLMVPGRHNARNATAAVAAMVVCGVQPADAARSLGGFTGVGRRFETKGETGGILVVDDYAHHPGEIRVILEAARGRYPDRRLWAVFQPHTYSRTKALMSDFSTSLSVADEIMLLDIYPSRETDNLGISAADLLCLLPAHARAGGTPAEAAELLALSVRAGDVVLTLGAGDVTNVGPALLRKLSWTREKR